MGENIEREWDAEPFPTELWHAHQLLEQDFGAGAEALAELGERGSALAMMYLGDALVSDSADSERLASGERWLVRSAAGGSIEGRFQLALHFQRQKEWEKARQELKILAQQGYSPAMYRLASSFYWGKTGDRSVSEAIHYAKMAKDAGHLPALALLSRIYGKEKHSLAGRVASHWFCLTKIPALVWCMLRYENSDRLRGLHLPSAAQQRA